MFKNSIAFALLFVGVLSNADRASGNDVVYGQGWIEKIGEYPVVHLKGTEKEMGEQLGYLAGDLIDANIQNLKSIGEKDLDFFQYIPKKVFTQLRRVVGAIFWITYSKDIHTHIEGIIDGAKKRSPFIALNRYDIAFVNSLIDLAGIATAISEKINAKPGSLDLFKFFGIPKMSVNCDSFAAWGPRTVGGKTFQTRNTDLDTGKGMEKYPLIMILKKEGKIPVVSASLAGMLGIFAGMNANGVGLGQVWTYSSEVKLQTPWHLQIRDVFMNARTAREALNQFSKVGKTAYGSNFIFADAGDGRDGSRSEGFAIEATAKQFAVFTANDPRELELKINGETVGLPLPYAVLRGDLALHPAIRAKQSAARGPAGDPRVSNSYQERYLGQYERILTYEQKKILIGKDQAISISKETAMKNSNLLNAVYANTDRDLWVTYSKMNSDGSTTQAYQRDYVNIPFYRYLPTLRFNPSNRTVSVEGGSRQTLRIITVSAKIYELWDEKGNRIDRLSIQ